MYPVELYLESFGSEDLPESTGEVVFYPPDNTLTVYYYDDFGALYALELGGVRYYVASDHLGTPKVIKDNTGVIVRQLEYNPCGVKINDSSDTSFDLPVGFAGWIPDDATGLVRFGFRDQEPGTELRARDQGPLA